MALGPYFPGRGRQPRLSSYSVRIPPVWWRWSACSKPTLNSIVASCSSPFQPTGLDPAIKQELSTIADMVLSFKVRTIGTDFETSMIVSKFRNAPENLKILVFRVTPEEGITPETVERIA